MTDIVSRKRAVELGLRKYFSGKTCIHGHLTERYTERALCVKCHAARCMRWHNKNNEKRQGLRETKCEQIPQGSEDVIRFKWRPPSKEMTVPPAIVPEPPSKAEVRKPTKRLTDDWVARAKGLDHSRRSRFEAKRHRQYPRLHIKEAAVTPLLMPLVDLQYDQCHYPFHRDGEGRRLFCGLQKMEGETRYCREHQELTHQSS